MVEVLIPGIITMIRTKTLVGNSDLMLVFDTKKRWTNLVTQNQIYDITQNYGWYEGSPGECFALFLSSFGDERGLNRRQRATNSYV